jgi:hypothetical protein
VSGVRVADFGAQLDEHLSVVEGVDEAGDTEHDIAGVRHELFAFPQLLHAAVGEVGKQFLVVRVHLEESVNRHTHNCI